MAQLVVSAAGAAIGSVFGPMGAQIGWALGSALYASSQTVRNRGPVSNDLRSPKLQYGTPIPRIYGRQRIAGIPAWMSNKRAVANTTSGGGKGGPKVENTTYTYEADCLYIVAARSGVVAVTRVWINGKLVYSALAESSDETLQASATTEAWHEIILYSGGPTQMPWPVYEAAVGTDDALAYRNRTTIAIDSLQFGSSDQPPLVEFEVITEGETAVIDANVLLQLTFQAGSIVDESSYAHPTTLGSNAVAVGAPENRLRCVGPNPNPGDGLQSSVSIAAGSAWALQMRVGASVLINGDACPLFDWGLGGFAVVRCSLTLSGGDRRLFIQSQSSSSQTITGLPETFHLELNCPGGPSAVVSVYVDGALVNTYTYGASVNHSGGDFQLCRFANEFVPYDYWVDDVQIYAGQLHTGPFTPPTHLTPDVGIVVWDPQAVDLADIVVDECGLAGLDGSQIDVSDIAGVEVTGFGTTGSARQAIEQLMAGYYFEACCSDELFFRRRGRAVAATIAYDDLAAGVDQASDTTFDPVRGNLEELPAHVVLGYINLSADYESGSEMGDRLIGPGKLAQRVDLPLVLSPAEAKGRALAIVMDALAAGTTGSITLTDDYAALEPTDAIVVPDRDGIARRMRIVRESYAAGVKSLELVGDDPNALVTTGLTMDESTPAIDVPAPADTQAVYLDIPLLKDAYDVPGFLVAATSESARWPGAAIFRSLDGASFTQLTQVLERAVIGSVTLLGNWTRGHKFDERNHVTATVIGGELASSTRAAMAADREVNVAAVGAPGRWEIIRFRSASLLAPGQYLLSGLLRGCLGTDWAIDTHEAGDVFVLLRGAGLRHVEHGTGDIGLERIYRAVTLGRNIGTAGNEAFTDTGVALKPYSPVDARASRDGDDITVTWRRRTRLQTRYWGPLPASVPLGEAVELYAIDVIDGGDVVATLTSSAPSITFDVTGYGLTPGDPVEVAIHQISATVGRGYALEATV